MTLEGILVFTVLTLPAFLLIAYALFDAVTAKRLSVARKVLWVAAILLTALIGVFFYFLFRPLPDKRSATRRGGNDRTAALLDLLERNESGEVEGDAFEAEKQALLDQATA